MALFWRDFPLARPAAAAAQAWRTTADADLVVAALWRQRSAARRHGCPVANMCAADLLRELGLVRRPRHARALARALQAQGCLPTTGPIIIYPDSAQALTRVQLGGRPLAPALQAALGAVLQTLADEQAYYDAMQRRCAEEEANLRCASAQWRASRATLGRDHYDTRQLAHFAHQSAQRCAALYARANSLPSQRQQGTPASRRPPPLPHLLDCDTY